MRNFKYVLFLSAFVLLTSCVLKKSYDEVCAELSHDELLLQNLQNDYITTKDSLELLIRDLRDSVQILKIPAEQRIKQIEKLISQKEYSKALELTDELERLFPQSDEIKRCNSFRTQVANQKEKDRKEEERIKALGYKVFKDNVVVKYENTTTTLSNFHFGRKWIAEVCEDVDEYTYEVCGKNNIYLLASASIYCKDDLAYEPTFHVCKIEDGNLIPISSSGGSYATYSSYGAKIGNYDDYTQFRRYHCF